MPRNRFSPDWLMPLTGPLSVTTATYLVLANAVTSQTRVAPQIASSPTIASAKSFLMMSSLGQRGAAYNGEGVRFRVTLYGPSEQTEEPCIIKPFGVVSGIQTRHS